MFLGFSYSSCRFVMRLLLFTYYPIWNKRIVQVFSFSPGTTRTSGRSDVVTEDYTQHTRQEPYWTADIRSSTTTDQCPLPFNWIHLEIERVAAGAGPPCRPSRGRRACKKHQQRNPLPTIIHLRKCKHGQPILKSASVSRSAARQITPWALGHGKSWKRSGVKFIWFIFIHSVVVGRVHSIHESIHPGMSSLRRRNFQSMNGSASGCVAMLLNGMCWMRYDLLHAGSSDALLDEMWCNFCRCWWVMLRNFICKLNG